MWGKRKTGYAQMNSYRRKKKETPCVLDWAGQKQCIGTQRKLDFRTHRLRFRAFSPNLIFFYRNGWGIFPKVEWRYWDVLGLGPDAQASTHVRFGWISNSFIVTSSHARATSTCLWKKSWEIVMLFFYNIYHCSHPYHVHLHMVTLLLLNHLLDSAT